MPVYGEAEKLGLPICVHTGQSCRHFLDFFDLELNGTFASSHLPPVIGFRDLVASEIPEKFPNLKFGFLEVSASWVPFLYHHLKRSPIPKQAGVSYDTIQVENEQPYQAIIAAAKNKGCDLIVMASHGRSGLSGVLLGSVTNKVLTHTKIPVLVCH